MKHLKIYFAVLFFSFLGAANVELMAQTQLIEKMYDLTVTPMSESVANGQVNYGKDLSILRSNNGQYELSVTKVQWKINTGPNNSYDQYFKLNFKLIKVGGSTIWEQDFPFTPNSSFPDKIYIGKGRIYAGNDPNYVVIGGNNGQGTGTYLLLDNDGELIIYGGSWTGRGDKVWSTGTCGGVLGGCGEVGAR